MRCKMKTVVRQNSIPLIVVDIRGTVRDTIGACWR
jgi:hypothetical protein